MFSKKQIYLVLIGLCFLIYANSLRGEFVSDDIPSIVKNPLISQTNKYIFEIGSLVNSLTFRLAKTNPLPYHLVSIIIHTANTLFVFVLLGIFFKTEASFLGAALFAIHPIHSEAVAWISGIGHLLIGFFILLTYLLYWRATYVPIGPKIDYRYYWACLAIFLYMNVGTFNFYILTPPFIIFSDLTMGKLRKNWKLWLPFFAIIGLKLSLWRGYSLIAGRIDAVGKESGLGFAWTNPVYNMSYSFFQHLALLVWPYKLTIYHEPPVITRTLLNIELTVLGIGLSALLFILFAKKARETLYAKIRPVFFGLGLFVLFLTPTYSPVLISWLVAERYAYIPSIAFCMWLAFAYEQYAGSSRARRRSAMTVFICLIAMYSVRTIVRNEDWKTPRRLWLSTTQVSPFSPRGHNNMGDVYVQEGNYEGAIREFKIALQIKPDYADVYHNLGNTFQFIGNTQEAIKNYEAALSYNPNLFESIYNLSIAYINTGQPDKAIELLNRGLAQRPRDAGLTEALQFALQKKFGKQ
jgi:protein O-mannosyl-transferase